MTKLLFLVILMVSALEAFAIGEDRNVQTTIENFIPITTTQMNALPSPQEGDVIWNSTSGTIYLYNGTSWNDVKYGLVDLATEVQGVLPRVNGGTGLSVAGTIGNVLTSDGTNWISSPASGNGDVSGPASSVDGEAVVFDGITGKLVKSATGSGVAHLLSGVLSASNVVLTSEVSGTLPIANGGTNSSTALSGSSIMISNGTSVIQGAAGTTTTVLHGNASGAPSYSAVSLTADVSGILPTANGGTGLSAAGTLGNILTSNGSIWTSSPMPSFIDTLNGLTASQQYFANGSTGTAPAFVSATATHTLNIPLASGAGVTSGTISKANYDAFVAKVDGPASSVDSVIALFDSTTGKLIKQATGTGVVHSTSGVYSVSNVVLTSEVSGILPIANGGTNSSTALSGSSIMVSNGTSVIQGSAGTTTTVLHGNAAGTPSYSAISLTADVSGILPRANGGTGLSAAGTIGNVLTSNGTDWISSPDADSIAIFGTRSTPRNIQAAGITTAASDMSSSARAQDIYVCGSNNGTTCNANVTLTTINAGTTDGQRMCIVGRGVQATQKVTINAGTTTNVELNGNAVLYAGRTICLRYDLTNWSEVSRNF